jgi:hypothetical protein
MRHGLGAFSTQAVVELANLAGGGRCRRVGALAASLIGSGLVMEWGGWCARAAWVSPRYGRQLDPLERAHPAIDYRVRPTIQRARLRNSEAIRV